MTYSKKLFRQKLPVFLSSLAVLAFYYICTLTGWCI